MKDWPPPYSHAWFGFLKAHAQITRALDAELVAGHGISLSDWEILARPARVEGGRLRTSVLAEQVLLSRSRVTRIVDALAETGLVAREACDGDSRAVEARITEAGLDRLRETQDLHIAGVERLFFAHLSQAELSTLATVFVRMTDTAGTRGDRSTDTEARSRHNSARS